MTANNSKARACYSAFTLIEFAVVLAVLGALTSLLVVGALKNSRQIKRVQCASNLQQFNLAMQIYGSEYGGRLPGFSSPGGYWPWDLPPFAGNFVEGTGSKWMAMYCPGTEPIFTEADNLLLYNFAPTYRVIGYAHTFPGASSLISTNVNANLMPSPILVAPFTAVTPLPAERVLLADATISGIGQNNKALQFSPTYNYTAIAGGFGKSHLSPHLSGRFPHGGNIAMLDGHVAWRQFKDMEPRTTGGSTPGFWW